MAITLTTDIVAGVLQAAPRAVPIVAGNRLDAGRTNSIGSLRFVTIFEGLAAAGDVRLPSNTRTEALDAVNSGPGNPVGAARLDGGKTRAFEELEAVFMRTVFESILPDDRSGVFGAGLAGSLLRSQAAEHYASLFASAGGMGLAEGFAQRY